MSGESRNRPAPEVVRRRLDCRPSVASALRCLHDAEAPFALVGDWAGGGAIMGAAPVRVAAADEDPFELIGETTRTAGAAAVRNGRIAVGGGWVGYLGYPLRHQVERCDAGPPEPPRSRRLPAFALGFYDHLVRCDGDGNWWFEALPSPERASALQERHRWWSECLADPPAARSARSSEWRLDPSPAGHAGVVAACRERIHAGDLLQANVCGQLHGRLDGPPLDLFIHGVTALAPARAAYVEGPWGAVASLSPELFLERHGRTVRTAPIKGTRARPGDERAAARERANLAASEKDRAENVMIVDLVRNDLGRVCEPGSVEVTSLAEVHPHTGVWHLVSEIRGRLRDETDDGDLLRATFPPGSVTGAPKIAAMNVIAELESTGRAVYTGAVGIASPALGLELSVAIRTFEVSGSEIRLGVGGGVVADSDPDAEARELAVKATPLLDGIGAQMPLPAPSRRGRAPTPSRLAARPLPRPDPAAGVFSTLLVRNGRAHDTERHVARLRASAAELYDLAPSPERVRREIEDAAAQAGAGSARLRIDLQPSGEIRVRVEPLAAAAPVSLRAWALPGGLGAHKWTDRRLLAAMEAALPGELPLLVDADGFVLETSRANVFVLGPDGVTRTPPQDGRILPGVVRALAIERGDVRVEPIHLEDLPAARRIIVTSSLFTSDVEALDGTPFPRDRFS